MSILDQTLSLFEVAADVRRVLTLRDVQLRHQDVNLIPEPLQRIVVGLDPNQRPLIGGSAQDRGSEQGVGRAWELDREVAGLALP